MTSLKTGPVVAFGFSTILLMGAVVTAITVMSISGLRKSVLELTDTQLYRRAHIEGLRSEIYVSSVLVRDYLLDRKPGNDGMYKDQLRENQASAAEHLSRLRSMSSGASSAAIESLTTELQGYWNSVEALLADTGTNSTASAFERLRSEIIPRRRAVIALAEVLSEAGAEEAREGRSRLASSMDAFRRNSVVLQIGATLFTAALALFTMLRVFHLESAATAEHARVERAEEEMRLLSQKVVTSQEQERRMLSRELHDHVGQMVTAIRFCLSDLERQCVTPSQEFTVTLGRCRSMVESTIEVIRGIAMGLRPSMLDDLGLTAAIQWQAREFSRNFNLPASVHADASLADCPEPQRTVLYRVTQEALTNCARHANARMVQIDLRQSAGVVMLSIADDGIGIAPGGPRRGFGLLGMDERVREIGGRMHLRSPTGQGTIIEVNLPLTRLSTNV